MSPYHELTDASRCRRISTFLRGLLAEPSSSFWRTVRSFGAAVSLSALIALSGCSTTKKRPDELSWLNEKTHVVSYRDDLGRIEHPAIDNETAPQVQATLEPATLQRKVDEEVRGISLADAIQTALTHNEVVESSALGGVGSAGVLTNPRFAASVYDPAIQESGVLFGGGLGVEAALSRFDPQFTTSALWGRSTATLTPRETAAFTSQLSKQFATGGTVALGHNWNYLGTPGNQPFQSTYAGNLGLSVRQPLLAGAGVEFTRIAGAQSPVLGAITGVGQGVVIARINHDISIAEFELAVRDAVRDIESTYWDLYLAYRNFDTAVEAYRSAQETWREANVRLDVGDLDPADEFQARDRLYETKADVEQSLSRVYQTESELRRLVGLPVNDGFRLRPTDEPTIGEFVPQWEASLEQALSQRTELRSQKWRVKSLQLQLKAANSLVRPSVNAVGSYDVNGVGDKLLSDRVIDPATGLPIRSGYGSMTHGDLESWTAGIEVTVPIGFRSQRSQVRNLELQLAKATAVLAAQEKNIAHDIATAIQDVTSAYAAAESNQKRLMAARRRVELLNEKRLAGTQTLDLVLRAQASAAAAQSAYYQQVVDYNKALVNLNLATGDLLEQSGVYLAEGEWAEEAYRDAHLRAVERTHAVPNPYLHTEPAEFVSPAPVGTIERHSNAINYQPAPHEYPPVMESMEPADDTDHEYDMDNEYDMDDSDMDDGLLDEENAGDDDLVTFE